MFQELLTVKDVAQVLRVPISWVYERTRRRGVEQIPHVKMGKYLRFDLRDIERWIEALEES